MVFTDESPSPVPKKSMALREASLKIYVGYSEKQLESPSLVLRAASFFWKRITFRRCGISALWQMLRPITDYNDANSPMTKPACNWLPRTLFAHQSIDQIYRNESALAVFDWVPAHGSGSAPEAWAEDQPVRSTLVQTVQRSREPLPRRALSDIERLVIS